MTNNEREIFSKLLDVNYEQKNGNHPQLIKEALNCYYFKLRDELIELMGEDEYKNFIQQGREMFAPKQD
jgi:hypothetical protein